MKKKIEYNILSSAEFGWSPEWLGLEINNFSEDLIYAVASFQQEYSLDPDGLVGPETYRRLHNWVFRDHIQPDKKTSDIGSADNTIVFRGEHHPIIWSKVVKWDDPGGLSCKSRRAPGRVPRMFVNHWDVCLSSSTCAKVLKKRGLGVHFCIDNDSTIYQLCDIENIAYHCGSANGISIGLEVADAYYPKYQNWYKKHKFGERPIMEDVYCHGRKLKPFLGFYDHQIQAIASLWAAVSLATKIPIKVPIVGNRVDHACAAKTFRGFCGHFHVTRKKIDPAGALPFFQVQEMAILIKLQMQGGE